MKPKSEAGRRKRAISNLPVIGWREWLSIPTLQIDRIKAKIDSGARTSSIQAFNIQRITDHGTPCVSFIVHPEQRRRLPAIECITEIFDERRVKSSNGDTQDRYVIRVEIGLGGLLWPIEVTLAHRTSMGFRMLLGRQAFRRRFLVDAGHSFIGHRDQAIDVTHITKKVKSQ